MKGAMATELSGSAADELLRVTPHRVDEEVSRLLEAPAFVFEDGTLLTRGAKDLLWDSRTRVVELFSRLQATNRLFHDGLGSGFAEGVEKNISALAALLGVPSASLDRSVDSLLLVDGGLSRMQTEESIPELVAYVGEVIREKVHGEWIMARGTEGISEPMIVAQNGIRYAPLAVVVRELDESPPSLVAAVQAALEDFS